MNKTLVLGVALSLVLVSGAFFSARADCGCFQWPSCLSLCNIHWPSFCCGSGNVADRDRADRDLDRAAVKAPNTGPFKFDYNNKHGIVNEFGNDKAGNPNTF
jgi:hypothetical protein